MLFVPKPVHSHNKHQGPTMNKVTSGEKDEKDTATLFKELEILQRREMRGEQHRSCKEENGMSGTGKALGAPQKVKDTSGQIGLEGH